ncbi:MAG: AraC family transcriptional regulator [Gammaproteobacteria bacterium]|nr:AraC family transcriptional regulator [Gammaproteobacteria bacterium]
MQLQAGSISEVAYKSGFGSPNYFGKSFKKQYGFSPKELRNPNLVVEEKG